MSFECARCHEYRAGCGADPPQFCGDCDGEKAKCSTCSVEFDWDVGTPCSCKVVHGEFDVKRIAIVNDHVIPITASTGTPVATDFVFLETWLARDPEVKS